MYKIHPTGFIRLADDAFIPADPENTDYRAVQTWVAAGNTPAPQDVVSTVPQSVTRYQGRMALHQENLLADVEAIIASADQPTRIAYEAGTWERGSQFVADMAAMLSLTSTRVDNLFILAGSL